MRKLTEIGTKIYYSKWFLIGVLLLGVIFRIHQYLLLNPLWLDEGFLAINIIRLNYLDFFKPLEYYGQAAPILFLITTKFLTKIFGINEYVLRFLPFLSSTGALIAGYFLGKLTLSKKSLPIFILILSFSRFAVYYAGEFKQYSTDLFFSTLILMLAFYTNKKLYKYRSFLIFSLASILAIWFSYPVIIVVLASCIAIAFNLIKKRKEILKVNYLFIAILAFFIFLSFFINYFYFTSPALSNNASYNYFSSSFPPIPPKNILDIFWYPKNLSLFYNNPLGLTLDINNVYNLPLFILILQNLFLTVIFLIAIIYIFKEKNWFKLIIIILIPSILFFLSVLQKYPLYERLILFIIPVFYLLFADGIITSFSLFKGKLKFIGIIILIIFILYPLANKVVFNLSTGYRTETKPVIQYYLKNRLADDKIYIYPSPWNDPVYIYYTCYYFKNLSNQIFISKKFEENSKEFIKEFKSKGGKGRVWIVLPYMYDPNSNKWEEVLSKIKTIGIEKDSLKSSSSIYLFEFN